MNFCLKCALIAGSLMALGATQVATPEQVEQARVSLCQAASQPVQADKTFPVVGDALIYSAIAHYGESRPEVNMAISRALFEYMTGQWKDCQNPEATKRLGIIMHEPHENGPQSS